MLEARRWQEDWPPRPLSKRTPRPSLDTAIKPSHDAYTEGQGLIKGHGYIPEEFRPIEEVEEEKGEKENDPLRKGFVPVEEAPDTTAMNPEEALLAKEKEGEEAVRLGIIDPKKAQIDQKAKDAAKEAREAGKYVMEFSPIEKETLSKVNKINTRRAEKSASSTPLTEEKRGGGYYTEKEKRDLLHHRKGPGGSGHPRRQARIVESIQLAKRRRKEEVREREGELAKFRFFKEWIEELNSRIRAGKFGKKPTSIRHHIEEELHRAEILFPDAYRSYDIFINEQIFEVNYRLKPGYSLPSMARRLKSNIEEIG